VRRPQLRGRGRPGVDDLHVRRGDPPLGWRPTDFHWRAPRRSVRVRGQPCRCGGSGSLCR